MASRVAVQCGTEADSFSVLPNWTSEQLGAQTEIVEINERLQEILELAPSDAAAEFTVERAGHGYRAHLSITSIQREFNVYTQGTHFSDVIDNAFIDLKLQLMAWKESRIVTVDNRI